MTDSVSTPGNAMGPSFTRDGRRWLETRADHLRSVVVPELQVLLDGGDHSVADEHERLLRELEALEDLIERSMIVDDQPDDPAVVELGETVTIALEDGSFERYRLVDPMESAVLGGSRVPADSPLGTALLGRRVGDEIEVDAPGGAYRCRVTSAERLDPPEELG
jgi:transcription elongation factor GreA